MNRDKKFFKYFFDSKYSTSHGSASWANYWEQRKLLKKSNTGVYIAKNLRLSPDASFKHLALVAPTGTQKTQRYILSQALGKWDNNTSLLFFDPSSEITNLSERWLQKQGFLLIKIDFNNPLSSAKHNPLLLVTNKNSARIVAQSLINTIYSESKSDPFWVESSISILTLLILAVATKIPIENRNIAFVNRLINKFGHSQEEVNSLMELALSDEDFEAYASYLNNSVKVRQSIEATIKSALYIYSDDVLKTISSKSTFSLDDLRSKKVCLMLIQDESQIPYFKSWWNLFFRQIFSVLMTSSKGNNVYCFMDEFANFGAIPDMEMIISTIRKKGVHLSIVLQSLEQLANVYNPTKAKIILENCTSKMFLSSLSYESSQIVSNMLGTTTESYSAKGIFKRNQPLSRISRPLLTPDEVRTLEIDDCLLIHGRYNPMKLKTKAFYQNRTLKRRSRL